MTSTRIDHLVVGADSLEQGAAWCERSLGVVPGPGGEHPLMGTHNRLLRIATVDHPRSYLEVIAPSAAHPSRHRPARVRRLVTHGEAVASPRMHGLVDRQAHRHRPTSLSVRAA